MAFQILREYGMDPKEIAVVVSAIGEHDEHTGTAVDAVSAALILADKTDVRRNRVPVSYTHLGNGWEISRLSFPAESSSGYPLPELWRKIRSSCYVMSLPVRWIIRQERRF